MPQQNRIAKRFETGVKGYLLWCVELELENIIISRDVKFDEFAKLHEKKEFVIVDTDHGVSKQVKLKVEVFDKEPYTYREVVSGTKFSQWAIVMNEEIESQLSSEFEMKDLGAAKKILGCVISWKANLQSIVALSTTEVEYMTAVEAV
ncbi:hypothetical protein EZV62_019651 [Acer yangbiense]|uniref:Uncharacterized protein n=1 Tax=Acer yangbiense TaxID=1000413 RepID=A0A5C7HCT0_9ROSI|nr:hypothetical protein EZV62_019651 [Acer yangbiense]